MNEFRRHPSRGLCLVRCSGRCRPLLRESIRGQRRKQPGEAVIIISGDHNQSLSCLNRRQAYGCDVPSHTTSYEDVDNDHDGHEAGLGGHTNHVSAPEPS